MMIQSIFQNLSDLMTLDSNDFDSDSESNKSQSESSESGTEMPEIEIKTNFQRVDRLI